jgi:hypothetical protein
MELSTAATGLIERKRNKSMNKASLIAEVTKAGFFVSDVPEYPRFQPFTSALGRITIAEKKIGPCEYSGVVFWVHEAENRWFLALFSPQTFLAKEPALLQKLALDFLSRRQFFNCPTGLSLDVVAEYQLEDWSDYFTYSRGWPIIISRQTEFNTLEDARRTGSAALPITRDEFVRHFLPKCDNACDVAFNGIEFKYKAATGIIRFVKNKSCLDFHEMLVVARPREGLTSDDIALVRMLCESLGCAAFKQSGQRII